MSKGLIFHLRLLSSNKSKRKSKKKKARDIKFIPCLAMSEIGKAYKHSLCKINGKEPMAKLIEEGSNYHRLN